MTLENLLRTLHNYHKRHGLTILFNESRTIWVRVFYCWLKVSTLILVSMFYLASFKTFTNNSSIDRMMNFLSAVAVTQVIVVETFFWMRRKNVLELVNWCRRVEEKNVELFHKPRGWFRKKNEGAHNIMKFIANSFVVAYLLTTFGGAAVQTYIFDDGYHFILSFDFKKFSERDSLYIFGVELIVYAFGAWFIETVFYLSFSFFILLANYIVGQLELLQYYTKQLTLNDPVKLKVQLRIIVEMHLDVLRMIKKFSNIYLPTLKGNESSLYFYVALGVFWKEMSIVIIPVILVMLLMIGYYCYACEKIMEAEQNIRDAYYELDWYKAPMASRKLLLLAMQEPEQIRFGRVFSYDYASMERFLLLVRRAYNFSLVLLKISMNYY